MADWVMKGDVDYYPDKIILTGEVAERVDDVWQGVEEGLVKRVSKDYSMFHAPNLSLYNPLHAVGHWKNFGTRSIVEEFFGADDHVAIDRAAANNNVFFSDYPNVFSQGLRGRALHNVFPAFHDSSYNRETREFSVTIKIPLPPSYINRMLTAYQWYLKLWDRVGDDNINWMELHHARSQYIRTNPSGIAVSGTMEVG